MPKHLYKVLINAFVALCVLSAPRVQASHIMGGNITYVCTSPGKYAVMLKLYRDCNGITLGNTAQINVASTQCNYNQNITLNSFGTDFIAPLCPSELDACENNAGVYGIEEYTYRGIITIPVGCGNNWVLNWSSCCRNAGITTLTASSGDGFYISARINNTVTPCNISPAFNNKPTVFFCANQENHYNQGVADAQGDSLVYSLVNCLDAATTPVGYASPYNGANPVIGTATLDARTGSLVIVPAVAHVGVLCIKVEEFRNNVKIGETTRDLQFIVTACVSNSLPIVSGIDGTADSSGVSGPYQIDVCVGNNVNFKLKSFDNEAKFPFQNITNMKWNNGIVGANFIVNYNVGPLPEATFSWTPTTPGTYDFLVSITDDACPTFGNNIFTYTINVLPNNLTLSATGGDTTVVSGQPVQLNASSSAPNVTYTWSPAATLSCTDCANPIATPQVTTTYTVTVGDPASGCYQSQQVTVYNFPIGSRNLDALTDFNVYPNPSGNRNATLTYTLANSSDVRAEVFDLTGRLQGVLLDEKQSIGSHQYDLSTLVGDRGIYLVRLTVNGKATTRKVVFY